MGNLKPLWRLYFLLSIVPLLITLVDFNIFTFTIWAVMFIIFLCTDDQVKYTEKYLAKQHIKEQNKLRKKHD